MWQVLCGSRPLPPRGLGCAPRLSILPTRKGCINKLSLLGVCVLTVCVALLWVPASVRQLHGCQASAGDCHAQCLGCVFTLLQLVTTRGAARS